MPVTSDTVSPRIPCEFKALITPSSRQGLTIACRGQSAKALVMQCNLPCPSVAKGCLLVDQHLNAQGLHGSAQNNHQFPTTRTVIWKNSTSGKALRLIEIASSLPYAVTCSPFSAEPRTSLRIQLMGLDWLAVTCILCGSFAMAAVLRRHVKFKSIIIRNTIRPYITRPCTNSCVACAYLLYKGAI